MFDAAPISRNQLPLFICWQLHVLFIGDQNNLTILAYKINLIGWFENESHHDLWSNLHGQVSAHSELFHSPRNGGTSNAHQSGRINWGMIFARMFLFLVSSDCKAIYGELIDYLLVWACRVLMLMRVLPGIDGHWMANKMDLLKSRFQQV